MLAEPLKSLERRASTQNRKEFLEKEKGKEIPKKRQGRKISLIGLGMEN